MTTNIFGLSNADLEFMRADAEALMPGTAVIYTLSRTADSMGGWSDTWTASGTAYCRLDAMSGRETIAGQAVQPYHGYTLTLPWNTTITTNNKVVIDSESFLVKSVDKTKTWPVTRRVYLERI